MEIYLTDPRRLLPHLTQSAKREVVPRLSGKVVVEVGRAPCVDRLEVGHDDPEPPTPAVCHLLMWLRLLAGGVDQQLSYVRGILGSLTPGGTLCEIPIGGMSGTCGAVFLARVKRSDRRIPEVEDGRLGRGGPTRTRQPKMPSRLG